MINEKEYHLTVEGLSEIKGQLQGLKEEALPLLRDRLRQAQAEEADPVENAVYGEVLREKEHTEQRIAELENIVRNHKLIKKGPKGAVSLGSTVVVEVEGRKDTFVIVGSLEADPISGKISDESPVGRALMGGKPGTVIEVTGSIVRATYKILTIG